MKNIDTQHNHVIVAAGETVPAGYVGILAKADGLYEKLPAGDENKLGGGPGGASLWKRTGTELSPETDGDSVAFGTPGIVAGKSAGRMSGQDAIAGNEFVTLGQLWELFGTKIKYGLLYNWYAATDARNICAEGWNLTTINKSNILATYLGGNSIAGGEMKEIGSTYWSSNVGANNSSKFNGRGSAIRSWNGSFIGLLTSFYMWESNINSSTSGYAASLINSNTNFLTNAGSLKQNGMSIRPVKDSTTLTHGQTGTYTGNDGKVYRTICIGTQEWLADNLAETRFRDGSLIPFHGSDNNDNFTNAEWGALTTAGLCAYNNDWSNV